MTHPSPAPLAVHVTGARPNFPKAAPVIEALRRWAVEQILVHTGQHYDERMSEVFFRQLGLPRPDVNLGVGSAPHGAQTAEIMVGLEKLFVERRPDLVVVYGDVNSTLSAALVAVKLQIPVAHVEAGLRSFDRTMPEEINRLVVDAVADLCCAPTEQNASQLRSEGVADERIVVTGNTLNDALETLLPTAEQQITRRETLQIPERFALCTIHRAGNVDDPQRLQELFEAVRLVSASIPVVIPLHPHTAKQLRHADLESLLDGLFVVPPLRPSDFLALEAQAALILSDSGGVQEEACFLRTPLLVLRDSTERPELLDGWCRLLGEQDPHEFVSEAMADLPDWSRWLTTARQPYPEQSASAAIIGEVERRWLDG